MRTDIDIVESSLGDRQLPAWQVYAGGRLPWKVGGYRMYAVFIYDNAA
jgi:hypothetical protein